MSISLQAAVCVYMTCANARHTVCISAGAWRPVHLHLRHFHLKASIPAKIIRSSVWASPQRSEWQSEEAPQYAYSHWWRDQSETWQTLSLQPYTRERTFPNIDVTVLSGRQRRSEGKQSHRTAWKEEEEDRWARERRREEVGYLKLLLFYWGFTFFAIAVSVKHFGAIPFAVTHLLNVHESLCQGTNPWTHMP